MQLLLHLLVPNKKMEDLMCIGFCFDGGVKRNSKQIRKVIHSIFTIHGVETNGKIADAIPAWAEEILALSVRSGAYRYQDISYYFAALCDRAANLTEVQRRAIGLDPAPIANDAIAAAMAQGKRFCDESRIELVAKKAA